MQAHSWLRRPAALVLALAAAGACAAGLPPEQQAGSARYVSGGVSDEEAAAFKAARDAYPLSIELVRQHGGRNEYTADAHVRVMDAAGDVVLEATAEGPFMLVRIPPGTYQVDATLDGQTAPSRRVTVGASRHAQALIAFRGD